MARRHSILEPGAEEFDACSRVCLDAWEHTRKPGECKLGGRRLPDLTFWRTFTASDGLPSMAAVDLDASLFLPWLRKLPVDEQWAFLERLADAKPEDRAGLIEQARAAAER